MALGNFNVGILGVMFFEISDRTGLCGMLCTIRDRELTIVVRGPPVTFRRAGQSAAAACHSSTLTVTLAVAVPTLIKGCRPTHTTERYKCYIIRFQRPLLIAVTAARKPILTQY
ncbi:hypothetical protein J6590_019673 [Homalodisca vitripennis]|nr:hypothetical protein J6590_019673 [Homalodisca vitripennis]